MAYAKSHRRSDGAVVEDLAVVRIPSPWDRGYWHPRLVEVPLERQEHVLPWERHPEAVVEAGRRRVDADMRLGARK
jgi:hypothetical protein